MRQFHFSDSLSCSAQEVSRLIREDAFMAAVYEASQARERRVLRLVDQDHRFERRTRIVLEEPVPSWMRPAVGRTLGYIETSVIAIGRPRIDVVIETLESYPATIRNRTKIEGVWEAFPTGQSSCESRFEGTIESRLPLIGSRVESLLERLTRSLFDAAMVTTRQHARS